MTSTPKYADFTGTVRLMPACVADGPAQQLKTTLKDSDNRQMALGTAHLVAEGQPLVVLVIVLGEEQLTVTLNAAEVRTFSSLLNNGIDWQNQQLRIDAEKAVH